MGLLLESAREEPEDSYASDPTRSPILRPIVVGPRIDQWEAKEGGRSQLAEGREAQHQGKGEDPESHLAIARGPAIVRRILGVEGRHAGSIR